MGFAEWRDSRTVLRTRANGERYWEARGSNATFEAYELEDLYVEYLRQRGPEGEHVEAERIEWSEDRELG